MSGFSQLAMNTSGEIIEVRFDSGEEAELESIIEKYPDALPISEINPLGRVAVPIGRQVTVGNNSLALLFLGDPDYPVTLMCVRNVAIIDGMRKAHGDCAIKV